MIIQLKVELTPIRSPQSHQIPSQSQRNHCFCGWGPFQLHGDTGMAFPKVSRALKKNQHSFIIYLLIYFSVCIQSNRFPYGIFCFLCSYLPISSVPSTSQCLHSIFISFLYSYRPHFPVKIGEESRCNHQR